MSMSPEQVMTIGRQAAEVLLMMSGPVLLVVLAIGLLVSIFQAATQINETTLTFIPKLLGVFAILLLAGPWMLSVFTDYLRAVFTSIPTLAG